MPSSPRQPASEVPATERTITLTCPSCQAMLRTAADQKSVEAPCPACGQLLRYEASSRAKPAPFQPLRRFTHGRKRRDGPAGGDRRAQRRGRSTGRGLLHGANDFLDSRNGILSASAVICLLLVLCVYLFLKWDERNRQARSPAPPPVRPENPPPSIVPINRPAAAQGNDPADPFSLPSERVIEPPSRDR